jgi:regulator of sigma E protease
METFIKIFQFILSLSILIVLHELGHFIPAKLFKTKVEKFYLFFDYKFSLFKKKIGDTVYGIGWIPLGGYVKIAGMIDESMDTEQLKEEPKPWEFRSKPAWQRLIIMLGGVTVNFILGIFIYIMILNIWGEQFLPNDSLKDGVWVQDELGRDLGLETGDKILTIDGEKVEKFGNLIPEFINGNTYTIERDGAVLNKEIPIDFISKLIERGKDEGSFLLPRMPFVIGSIPDDSHNLESGLKTKDIITVVGNTPIRYYDEAKTILGEYANKNVNLTIQRNNEDLKVPVTISDEGTIGVSFAGLSLRDMNKLGYLELKTRTYSFGEAIPGGFKKAYNTLASYVKQFKKIFNPKTGAYKGLGGFITIGSIFPAEWDWQSFLNITAFLSIMLGFMNLLPIPALDGGHVVFTLYEMVSGRKPSDKFLEYAQITGFVILMALLLFANGNDIYRWITG